jgi:hypothetical protein
MFNAVTQTLVSQAAPARWLGASRCALMGHGGVAHAQQATLKLNIMPRCICSAMWQT